MSCELQGLYNSETEACSSSVSVAGITHVWLIPFDDVSNYTYTNDYPHAITGYSSLSVPVLYRPNDSKSEYKGEYAQGNHRMWKHTLTLNFIKMTTEKRRELVAMEDLDLVAIFKDKNGLCWIMGQDYPVKLKRVAVGTGNKNGENSYDFELQSIEKQHIRAIECPQEGCFVSFTGTESRRSYFTITGATSLDWTNIEITADESTYSYSPVTAIDLSLWDSDPTKEATDKATITQMFGLHGGTFDQISDGAGGYIDNPVISWDSGADELTIVAFSSDTTFGTLKFGGVDVFGAAIEITLNLKTVLSPAIANSSTIIKLEDSTGTVYQTAYGASVATTNISGTSDDVTIIVSSEYPTGTTFSISTVGLTCSEVEYEYLYENALQACSMSREHEFFKGEQVRLSMPIIERSGETAPRFQTMTLNLNGVIHSLYKNYTEWHDDFTQFQSDIINSVSQTPGIVDPTSLTFTDNTTYIDIEFRTTGINNDDENPYFKVWNRGLDAPTYTDEGWIQSRAVQLKTVAPYPAVVTHTDINADTTSGQVLGAFATTDLELVKVPTTSNTSIEDIAIKWGFDGTLGYTEASGLTTTGTTDGCVLSSVTGALTNCYTGYSSAIAYNMVTMTLDVTTNGVNLNDAFEIEGNFGTISTTLPVNVSPNDNWHWLTNWISSIKGLKVIHMDYSPVERKYYIYVRTDLTTTITRFSDTNYTGRDFTLVSSLPVYANTMDTKINPYITFNWTLPLRTGSTTTGAHDMMHGHWIEDETDLGAIEVEYDQSSDQITISKITSGASTTATSYSVTLHEDYPTQTNNVWFGVLTAGSSSTAIGSVSTTLSGNGSSEAAVKYIAYTNYMAQRYILPIDITSTTSLTFNESYRTPEAWGTLDSVEYVGTAASGAPTIVTIC